ncbi:unnamed protein product [Periconia digitata]|uniref:Uncharacterized protein n=1 Tax=Periconia digitata TaxID=1303443 RepID=A0A9W4U2Z0_9PLEO|nr:unnamed protein product [Periconia digitata]
MRQRLICQTSPSRPPGRPSNGHQMPHQNFENNQGGFEGLCTSSSSSITGFLNRQIALQGLEGLNFPTEATTDLTASNDPLDTLWMHSLTNQSSNTEPTGQAVDDEDGTASFLNDLQSSSTNERPGFAFKRDNSPTCLIALLSDVSGQIDHIKNLSWDTSQIRLNWLDFRIGTQDSGLQNPLEMTMWTTMKFMLVLQLMTPSNDSTPPIHQSTTPIKLVVISTYLQLLDLLDVFLSQVRQRILEQEVIPNGIDEDQFAFRYHVKGTMELIKHHLVLIENYFGLPEDMRYWPDWRTTRGFLNVQEASMFRHITAEQNQSGTRDGVCRVHKLRSTIQSLSSLLS